MPITRISGGGGTLDYNSLSNKPDLSVYSRINGFYSTIKKISSNYDLLLTDGTILCDSTSNISVTLLSASTAYNETLGAGLVINIKNINTGIVTVIGNVDNVVNPTINSQWDSLTLQSDGISWYLI